jgi:hypothetical protein
MGAPSGWQVRATRLLRRHRGRRAQLFLLDPPEGFGGRLRLGVIGERRRVEYTAAWPAGARTPLVFEVTLPRATQARAEADLLFEITRAGRQEPPEVITSHVVADPVARVEIVYLAPLLAAPDAAAAFTALRRDRALRLGLVRGSFPRRPDPLAAPAERLARAGRLAELDPAAIDEAPEPLGRDAWRDPGDARLVLHIHALIEEAARRRAAAPPPAGSESRSSALPEGAGLRMSPLPEGADSRMPIPMGVEPPPIALWIERLSAAEDLGELGRCARRWNRRFVTPRLLPATLADWRTAQDEAAAGGFTLPWGPAPSIR